MYILLGFFVDIVANRLLLTNPSQICSPAFTPVSFRLGLNGPRINIVAFAIDTSANNYDVAARVSDNFLRSPVLLSHRVAARVQTDSRCQDQEVLFGVHSLGSDTIHAPLCNEANNEVAMVSCHTDSLLGICSCGEATLGAHFSK